MAPDPSLFLSPLQPSRPPPDEPGVEGRGGEAPPGTVAIGRPGRRGGRVGPVVAALALAAAAAVANRMSDDGGAMVDGAAPVTTEVERRTATTERARRTTTTTTPPVLMTAARLGPRLPAPTGTTVVLVGHGRVVVADLDSGTVRTVPFVGQVYGSNPFPQVLVVDGSFLLAGERPQLLARSEGAASADLDLSVLGGYLPSARPDAFWTVDQGFDVELVERTLVGETGRRVTLSGEGGPIIPAGDGFITSLSGSVVRVDATSGAAERIGGGTAVAFDGRTLVRSGCDDALECGLVLSDPAGEGERLVGPPTPRSRYDTYSGARFSPDGRWLTIPFYGEDQPGGLVLVDVERGVRRPTDTLTTASGGGFPASAAFTVDSRWLLVADQSAVSGRLKAIDLADGSVIPIDLGLGDAGRRGDDGGGLVLTAFPSVPGDADLGG